MIQLNNYSTGAIIVIEDNKMKPTGVFYKKYTNPYFRTMDVNRTSEDNKVYCIDKKVDYVSDTYQSSLVNPTFKEFEIDGCIANILAVESGFELSTDEQCWLKSIRGIEMPNKIIRLVANEKLIGHIRAKDALGSFFLSVQDEFMDQTIDIDGITYIYVSSINEEEYPGITQLLATYSDTVTIEYKKV